MGECVEVLIAHKISKDKYTWPTEEKIEEFYIWQCQRLHDPEIRESESSYTHTQIIKF